jgi:hypothetical protein
MRIRNAISSVKTTIIPHSVDLKLAIAALRCRFLSQTDKRRWSDPRNIDPAWDARTQTIAHLIPQGSRVIEFGAGLQRLESYLDQTCTYIPTDVISRNSSTVVVDLNKRPLPDFRALAPNIAVFGGVLEETYLNGSQRKSPRASLPMSAHRVLLQQIRRYSR